MKNVPATPVFAALMFSVLLFVACQKPVDVRDESPQAAAEAKPAAKPSAPQEADVATAPEGKPQAPAALAAGTDDQKKLLTSALEQVAANELDAAAMGLLVLIKDGPDSLEKLISFIVLAEIYLTEERFDRGIERLEEHRSAFPPTAEYDDALSRLYVGANRLDEGIVALRRAVDSDPARLDLLARLTQLLHDHGDDAGAKAAATRYDQSLEVSFALLRGKDTPIEARLGTLELFGTLRDPRISTVLVEMLGAEDLSIVSAALESIVNSGSKDAVPGLRARAESEERAQVKEGLLDAANYLEAMEGVPELPMMPLAL